MNILQTKLFGLLRVQLLKPVDRFICNDTTMVIDLSDSTSCEFNFEKNELIGLYFTEDSAYMGRFVSVLEGEFFLVAVDIRINSATYGQWYSEKFSHQIDAGLWIPRGFAYGGYALTDNVKVLHRVVGDSDPQFDRCIRWNDQDLSIIWPLDLYQGLIFESPKLGARESSGEAFASINSKL